MLTTYLTPQISVGGRGGVRRGGGTGLPSFSAALSEAGLAVFLENGRGGSKERAGESKRIN